VERILVIGCSGSGKSTLARRLSRELALPLTCLDRLFWQPGWRASPESEFTARVAQAVSGPRWVIDGNYTRTLPLRLARADCVIWLDVPRAACLARVLWRWARHASPRLTGRTALPRADMAPGCPEKLDMEFLQWIWNFRAAHHARTLALLTDWLGQAPRRGWTTSGDGARRVWWGGRWDGRL
jgi:adenylate kinase family enzyme